MFELKNGSTLKKKTYLLTFKEIQEKENLQTLNDLKTLLT